MAHTSKAGRNELCTCGSGKKFKKCCGIKQDARRGNTFMLIFVGLLVVAGAAAVIRGFTAERTHVARPGGGRRWFAASSRNLRQLFGTALNELRARYLITYYPSTVPREGWHDVKVTLKNARGEVTARPGYFVSKQ